MDAWQKFGINFIVNFLSMLVGGGKGGGKRKADQGGEGEREVKVNMGGKAKRKKKKPVKSTPKREDIVEQEKAAKEGQGQAKVEGEQDEGNGEGSLRQETFFFSKSDFFNLYE
jgi:hypothetical protein